MFKYIMHHTKVALCICLIGFFSQSAFAQMGDEFGWAGKWVMSDKESDKVYMTVDLYVKNGKLGGTYVLTPHFCQTNLPNRPSVCPFSGAKGEVVEVLSSPNMINVVTPDPFLPDEQLHLTMYTLSKDNIDMASIAADGNIFAVVANAKRRS